MHNHGNCAKSDFLLRMYQNWPTFEPLAIMWGFDINVTSGDKSTLYISVYGFIGLSVNSISLHRRGTLHRCKSMLTARSVNSESIRNWPKLVGRRTWSINFITVKRGEGMGESVTFSLPISGSHSVLAVTACEVTQFQVWKWREGGLQVIRIPNSISSAPSPDNFWSVP